MDQHNFEMIHFKCTIPAIGCTIPVLLCSSKRQTRFEVSAVCFEFGRAFFLFVLFFGSLAPVEDNNEKKNAHSHTANDRQTNSNNTKK